MVTEIFQLSCKSCFFAAEHLHKHTVTQRKASSRHCSCVLIAPLTVQQLPVLMKDSDNFSQIHGIRRAAGCRDAALINVN